MGEKTVTYETERISIKKKKQLALTKRVLRLLCVIHGRFIVVSWVVL